jgi:hypothetical protein
VAATAATGTTVTVLLLVRGGITTITHTRARLTASTDLAGSSVASLSGLVPGITGTGAGAATMAAAGTTVVQATAMAAVGMATLVAE